MSGFLLWLLPSSTLEEPQVAIELQEFSLPGSKALISETWIGRAPRASAPECLFLLLCLYTFAAAIIL